MKSVWESWHEMPSFPPLAGEIQTDVLIVGGGMAGVLCAWRLSQQGVRSVLIEQNRICSGITAGTTAKLTSQHGLVYEKLLRKFGRDTAKVYWKANTEAVDAFRELAKTIACDFQDCAHTVYSVKTEKTLDAEIRALEELGIAYDYLTSVPLPLTVKGAVRFQNQAQFHPLKIAAGIAGGLNIYEHTTAREFLGNTVMTDQGRIRASRIIIATHFPILNKHGGYFLRMYQERSYVLAVENAMDVKGMYLAAEADGFSFRNWGSALLIGQGGHRTGKKSQGWQYLDRFAAEKFPQKRILARWANQDCMTLDGLPYIGRYSRSTPELYVATGFQKWGMTQSMVASRILADLVQDREDPYGGIFSPQRSFLHAQLLCNGLEAAANLVTPTIPRCPHLGCALKWNPRERSWDCPCHGSRFSQDGGRLNEPATGDLPEKKTKT